MAQLAIKGHKERGVEVIALLEMLGGKIGCYKLIGNDIFSAYYINVYKYIDYKHYSLFDDAKVFTLEEFLEKYPFKVGDFVSIPEYESEVRICEMQWDGFEIQYKVYRVDEEEWYASDELLNYNDNPNRTIKDMEEKLTAIPEITTLNMSAIDYNNGLVGYEIPAGYEFDTVIDNKVVLKLIKLQYPKTYEECCKILIGKTDLQDCELVLTNFSINQYKETTISYKPPHIDLINDFYKLLICRDAYWKIAGEQMGLRKPWQPDWLDAKQDKYVIFTNNNTICSNRYVLGHNILAFPTEEMRDAFFKNFEELIKKCISLL